jgi:hypothetical protein
MPIRLRGDQLSADEVSEQDELANAMQQHAELIAQMEEMRKQNSDQERRYDETVKCFTDLLQQQKKQQLDTENLFSDQLHQQMRKTEETEVVCSEQLQLRLRQAEEAEVLCSEQLKRQMRKTEEAQQDCAEQLRLQQEKELRLQETIRLLEEQVQEKQLQIEQQQQQLLLRGEEVRELHQTQHDLQIHALADCSGLKSEVCEVISDQARIPPDAVYGVFIFMYSSGSYELTSRVMRASFPERGWGLRSTKSKIPLAAAQIARLQDRFISPATPQFALPIDFGGLLPQDYQLALDTVPIESHDRESPRGRFNPKYAHAVMKVLVVCTMRGFVVYVSPPFDGSVSDSEIYQHFDKEFQEKHDWKLGGSNVRILADCAFPPHPRVTRPWRGPQIWPNGGDAQSGGDLDKEFEYLLAADTKLRQNEQIAHFRSRIEHQFAAPMFNRWRIFSLYRGLRVDLLDNLVKAAFICLNIETYLKHGSAGRYKEYSETKEVEVWLKILHHPNQNSRYPRDKALEKKKKKAKKQKKKKEENEKKHGPQPKSKRGRKAKVEITRADVQRGTQMTIDQFESFVTKRKKGEGETQQ